jgi:uncharacterized protein YegP (UPF0339 family)
MRKITCRIFRGTSGEFFWTLIAGNSRRIAGGHEGYMSRYGATRAAKRDVEHLRNAFPVEIYQDDRRWFRWRLRAKNNQITCTGLEGYADDRNIYAAIRRVRTLLAKGVRYDHIR